MTVIRDNSCIATADQEVIAKRVLAEAGLALVKGVVVPSAQHHAGIVVTVGMLTLGVGLAGCGSAHNTAKAAPAQIQGANPVAWVGVYCAGFAEVVAAQDEETKIPPTPQGHKDGLLMVADAAQHAFTDAAHQLTQLGPPAITDGKRAQDTVVGFFTIAAAAVGDRHAKLAALDANDPDFTQKASQQLAGPDISAATTKMQELTGNPELASAFSAAPQCQRLRDDAAPQ